MDKKIYGTVGISLSNLTAEEQLKFWDALFNFAFKELPSDKKLNVYMPIQKSAIKGNGCIKCIHYPICKYLASGVCHLYNDGGHGY